MASSRIKGITIEIGGDTTELSSALSKVDREIKETQSTLRDLNKLLKLDPGNTELLTQKQKALQDQLKSTKDRLKELQDAQAQIDEGTKEWDALQREIVDTEQKVKSLTKQYQEFGSVSAQQIAAAGEKVKNVGEGMTDLGKGMTAAVTTPIVGAGAASVAAFKEVDEALDIVEKKTGATGDELTGLEDIVKSIATTIPTDFRTAAEAVGEVNTRFGVQGDKLADLSEQYVKFAALNEKNVSDSIDVTQKALSAYGKTADDASGYLDVLNKVSQETGIDTDKLAESIISNSAAFQEMGLSLEQATVFTGGIEKSGVNAETALNGMRKALKNAVAEGKPLNEALSELQNTILNGTGSMDGLTAAYDLFGKSGDQIYSAVKNGTIDFQNLAQATEDSAGSVNTTYETMLDPLDEVTQAFNELKLIGADIAESAMPILADVLGQVRDILTEVKSAWEQLSPETQQAIINAGLIAAAVGPVLVVIGQIVTAIGSIMTLAPAIVGAFGTVAAFLTGTLIPAIGGVIAAVAPIIASIAIPALIAAAIVAAVVLIVKHWDEIKEKAKEVWEKVKEAWENLKENTKKVWDGIKDKIKETWENIKSNVKDKIDQVKSDLKQKWDDIKSDIQTKVTGIKDKVQETFQNMKDKIKEKVGDIKDEIKDGFQKAIDWIKDLPNQALQWGRDMIGGIIDGIREKIGGVADAVSGVAGTISEYIHFSEPDKGPLSDFHTYMPDMMSELISGIQQSIPKVQQTMESLGSAMLPNAQAVQGKAGNSSTVNGGINITVYGAQGQDVNQLADIIQQRMNIAIQNQEAVFA